MSHVHWEHKTYGVKKVGVILRGIASGNSTRHKKDWTFTKDNIKKNLIDPLVNPSIYLTTYEHAVLPDVIEFYKPKDVKIVDFNTSNQIKTFLQSLEQIANEDLDFVFIARFDIEYKKLITDFNINYDKFNFIFREQEPYWSSNKYTSDTFFAFSKKFLEKVIEATKEEIEKPDRSYGDIHALYKKLLPKIGEENINFMFEGNHPSDVNEFFEIKRI